VILKKPYAFFIKIFKPIHLFMCGLVLYLVYLSNNILKFLNDYIYSSENFVEEEIVKNLVNNFIYIIPAIIIALFLVLLSIMYKKNKPILFYFVGIFSFIVILVINVYAANFLNVLIENIVSVKTVKLIHDLVLINVILESFIFLFLFIRGIGIDFKKFEFNSDISKIEISEMDKEEFEVDINIDFNERKRRRKEKIRNFKYLYVENKFLINIIISIIVGLIIVFGIFFIYKNSKVNKEGVYYTQYPIIFKVNNTTKLNTDYRDNKLTDNYLIAVEVNIKSNSSDSEVHLNDFNLVIENVNFKPVIKYNNSLIDLGNFYDEQLLPLEYTDYLFVYEIPEKYIESKMYLNYGAVNILLEPQELSITEISDTKKLGENLIFEGALKDVKFKINNYSLSDKFLIEYKYCIKKDDCILSKEYLRASINENYDKTILKLNVDYNSNSDLDINTFYKLLSKFGTISYKIGDNWFNAYKFEEIKSKKVVTEDIYIGVNSDIMNSESIKIMFNVRGLKYEYLLK